MQKKAQRETTTEQVVKDKVFQAVATWRLCSRNGASAGARHRWAAKKELESLQLWVSTAAKADQTAGNEGAERQVVSLSLQSNDADNRPYQCQCLELEDCNENAASNGPDVGGGEVAQGDLEQKERP